MSAAARGEGALRQAIAEAKKTYGKSLDDLTVMAAQHDPFRHDTKSGHRNGAWFAEMVQRFVKPGGKIHLRGLHYAIVATGSVLKPGCDEKYENTDECWQWLNDRAAKPARWLGYVPWERIVDERNAEPLICVPQAEWPGAGAALGDWGSIPSLNAALPGIWVSGFEPRQSHRLIFIGEKTSLDDVLRPIVRRVGGEMLLMTGNASLTRINELAQRASQDGRQAVVFYFSDFDPAGHNMATVVARALQAHCVGGYPDLKIELHAVALTKEQCIEHDLPSTPLNEKEKRKDKWIAGMGREQTEIDALATLRPDVLRKIAEDAIAPFYDATLGIRSEEAKREWLQAAYASLETHPEYEAARLNIANALAPLEKTYSDFRDAQRAAERALESVAMPPIEAPLSRPTGTRPQPLFSSEDGFFEATQRLVDRKNLSVDDSE